MQYLRGDTAATILIGPAVAVADGVTPVTDVTLAGADHAELMKHDGTTFVDLTADSRTLTHKEGGWYTLTLGTGDTDTKGRLKVLIMDTDKCLPVWEDCMVLAPAAYDSLFGANAMDWADILLLLKIEKGRWKVVNFQLIFYDEDKVTPLLTFDLKDKNGQPTMASPYERSPV